MKIKAIRLDLGIKTWDGLVETTSVAVTFLFDVLPTGGMGSRWKGRRYLTFFKGNRK